MEIDKDRMRKWEEAQRELQKYDADKSRGLLVGTSGLGTKPKIILTPEVDLYAKYSHYEQFRDGIRELDKATADFIIQNDLDPETVQLDVTVNAEYSYVICAIRVYIRYRLDYSPVGRLGLVESHFMDFSVFIDGGRK